MIAGFIVFCTLLGVAVFAGLALPVLRGEGAIAIDRRKEALGRRLDAIDRDRRGGLIGESEAGEAAIEAKRAALDGAEEPPAGQSKPLRFAAILYLALAPLVGGALYVLVGAPSMIAPKAQPTMPTNEAAIAALPEAERQAMIQSMVAGLSARLEETPDDPDGWRMLARSQMVLGRPVDSAASYRRLLALEEGSADDWRNFAVALFASFPEGRFPTDPEFLSALSEIEKRAPGDPMVLFYRGGAARETGDIDTAISLWSALIAAMPADAPVRGTLVTLIEEMRAGGPDSQPVSPEPVPPTPAPPEPVPQ